MDIAAQGPPAFAAAVDLRRSVGESFRLPGSAAGVADGYWVAGSTDGSERMIEGLYPKQHVVLTIGLKGADPSEVDEQLARASGKAPRPPGLLPYTDGRTSNVRRGMVAGHTAYVIGSGIQVSDAFGKMPVAAQIVWYDSGVRYGLSSYESSATYLQSVADSMYYRP